MPFESKKQWKKCFAMKARGQAKGWNCREWAHKTEKSFKKLPRYKPEKEKVAIFVHTVMEKLAAKGITPLRENLQAKDDNFLGSRGIQDVDKSYRSVSDPSKAMVAKQPVDELDTKIEKRMKNVAKIPKTSLDTANRRGSTYKSSLSSSFLPIKSGERI